MLKDWVKNTLLFNKDLKKKILAAWSPEIEQVVNSIYLKYGKKEKKILKNLEGKMSTIYTQAISYIESQHKSKELEEIKKLEQIISKL